MVLLLPAVLGVIVYVINHGAQLTVAAQDGLVVVCLKECVLGKHPWAADGEWWLLVTFGTGDEWGERDTRT